MSVRTTGRHKKYTEEFKRDVLMMGSRLAPMKVIICGGFAGLVEKARQADVERHDRIERAALSP